MGIGESFGEWLSKFSASTFGTLVFGGTCFGAVYCLYVTSKSNRNKRRVPGSVPPMVNLGNTCYANSLLQALASSSSLVNWLSKLDIEDEIFADSLKLISAFKQTVTQLNDPNTESCSAADIILALLDHRWSIPPNVEQDLYELFDVVVTTWDEELAKLKHEKGLFLLRDLKTLFQNVSLYQESSSNRLYGVSSGNLKKQLCDSFREKIVEVPTFIRDSSSIENRCSGTLIDYNVTSREHDIEEDSAIVIEQSQTPNISYSLAVVVEQNKSDCVISQNPDHADKDLSVTPSSDKVSSTWIYNPEVAPQLKSEFSCSDSCESSDMIIEINSNASGSPYATRVQEEGFQQKCYKDFSAFSLSALVFQHIKVAVAEERRLRLPCSGLLITQMQCMNPFCHYTKLRQDRFCVLSLSIPKVFPDAWLSLDLLMRKYFCSEPISDASCDKCVERSSVSGTGIIKKHGLCRLPSLLVLRVERVLYMSSGCVFKRTDRFSFPEILDVEKFCFFAKPQAPKLYNGSVGASSTFPFADAESLEQLLAASVSSRSLRFKYRLRAVSVHMGEPQSGHFITYRRGVGSFGDNAWYKTSDSQVTRVPFSEVAACEAYMLYYDRILPLQSYS